MSEGSARGFCARPAVRRLWQSNGHRARTLAGFTTSALLTAAGVFAGGAPLLFTGTAAASSSYSSARSSDSGTLQLTGAVHEVVKLTRADCTSDVHEAGGSGTMDIFDVAQPSIASEDPSFVFTLQSPNPKSVYYTSTSTIVVLRTGETTSAAGTKSWQHEFQELPSKIPSSEIHFATNGKSGRLDLTLSPESGTKGTVHAVATWSGGTCGQAMPKIILS
jgi:hypothetical protein